MCKLLLGAENVDRPKRVVDDTGNVEALVLLSESIDLGDFVLGELDIDEVLSDTRRGNGLGDDAVAAFLGPGETMTGFSKPK